MTSVMKFEKKPVQVEAMWYMGDSIADEIVNWIRENAVTPTNVTYHKAPEVIDEDANVLLETPEESHISIHTLGDLMRADPGDWIIRGIKGEFYPCPGDVFEATYIQVTFPADMIDEVV